MRVSVTDAKGQLTELSGEPRLVMRSSLPVMATPPCVSSPSKRFLSRKRAGEYLRRPVGPVVPRRALVPPPRGARTSSMAMTVCPNDRGRYLRADGDRSWGS